MQEKSFSQPSRSSRYNPPVSSGPYPYKYPGRPPIPREPWVGLSENTIFFLALIGIIIFLIGATLSVSAIRTDQRPDSEDYDWGEDYDSAVEEYKNNYYDAKRNYKIGIIILITGAALISLALILGGCYSEVDIDIRTMMIRSGVALLIAIIVLVLIAPITGMFPGEPGFLGY